jgi:hypothetical protein
MKKNKVGRPKGKAKKISKNILKKNRKPGRRGRPRKPVPKVDAVKLAFLDIKKEFKRLKKSKLKMQFLWYRTKKEHLALMKELDKKIKELKADIKKNKIGKAKLEKKLKAETRRGRKAKPVVKKTAAKKYAKRGRPRKVPAIAPEAAPVLETPAKASAGTELKTK